MMTKKKLFDSTSYDCSKLITNQYSTSFSIGIKMLRSDIQQSIYAIYGFVRYADEIVDSFHGYNQAKLLDKFEADYYQALEDKISLNPILNAFQEVVHRYQIQEFVPAFLKSMRMDLAKTEYLSVDEYQAYIYGSADVVGLMCLKVFVEGDQAEFERLKAPAMRLGSAFQKVNFLRDFKDDMQDLGRSYFPNINLEIISPEAKQDIISDIEKDFQAAYKGILQLPNSCKFGVFTAYKYYLGLLKKIKRTNAEKIMKNRIRIPDSIKLAILMKSYVRYKLDWM